MNKIINNLSFWIGTTSKLAEDLGIAGKPINRKAWNDNDETDLEIIKWALGGEYE